MFSLVIRIDGDSGIRSKLRHVRLALIQVGVSMLYCVIDALDIDIARGQIQIA